MLSKSVFVRFIIIIIPFCYFACAKPMDKPLYEKNGTVYGTTQGAYFSHRWWSYYERGLSYADGGYYNEAVDDFLRAVNQRDSDQRRARTYGFHFIDYFPNRELGIIYYDRGNLSKAKEKLELSLHQYPSAKAGFYLDKVRKALIEQDCKSEKIVLSSIKPPAINLGLSGDEIWTNDDPIVLSGEAVDKYYVNQVRINSRHIHLAKTNTRVRFQKTLRLPEGRHAVNISARNLMGRVSTRTIILNIDRQGPVVAVDDIRIRDENRPSVIRLSGSIVDPAGVRHLTINNKPIEIKKEKRVEFSEDISPVNGVITISASDGLGNLTHAALTLEAIQAALKHVLIAQNTVLDEFWVDLNGLLSQKDEHPPQITIKGLSDFQTVYFDKIYLEGMVRDQAMVAAVTVNDIPIFNQGGKVIFFNHVADLKVGANTIRFEAEDSSGNRVEKNIHIQRKQPQPLRLESRMSLAVMPYSQNGRRSEKGASFQSLLTHFFVKQQRFHLVERLKIEDILTEQHISASELVQPKIALKAGRLIAAHCIVSGRLIESNRGLEIVSEMIDTETSEIIATEDVYSEAEGLAAMRALADGTAIKFHIDFPLVTGVIVDHSGDSIVTDMGQDKLKSNKRLIVYREKEIIHPKTRMSLGIAPKIIDQARITDVSETLSKAVIFSDSSKKINVSSDMVITQ